MKEVHGREIKKKLGELGGAAFAESGNDEDELELKKVMKATRDVLVLA